MNHRTKKIIKFFILFLVSLYVAKEILLTLSCEVSFNIATHLNPYRLVRELNTLPRNYYFSERPIDSYDSLITESLSDFPRLKDYKYSAEITENAIFHQVYEKVSRRDICVKNTAPLLSFFFYREETPRFTLIGAIFFDSPQYIGTYQEIICQSKIPGDRQLNKPYLQNGEPVCGEGTSEFVVN